MDQLNLFEVLYEKYRISHKIRIIELFGGIGSQSRALERLQEKGKLPMGFEHYRLVEFDKYPVASYNAIHGTNFDTMDITKIHASNLGIVDRDKYDYIMTYSFPCQDLSLAGKGKGMKKGTGTRSGLLWEVERLLTECDDNLPQILLMENVPQVIGEKNINDFKAWQLFLEEKGYSNYVQILNAKDYGIPQNRQRCFMVSIQGEAYYEFPKPIPLKLKLRDMLETEVDEKYYLSDKMMAYVLASGTKNYQKPIEIDNEIARTINTTPTSHRSGIDNYLSERYLKGGKPVKEEEIKNFKINKHLEKTLKKNNITECKENDVIDAYNQSILKDGVYPTITTKSPASDDKYIFVKNATKKGYLKASEGDGIDISSRMHHHRGTVQKDSCQTLDTQCNVGVVVKIGNYSPSGHNAASVVDSEGIAPTVMENHGTVTAIVENEIKNYPCYKCKHWISAEFGGHCTLDKERKDLPCDFIELKEEFVEPKVIGGIGEKKSNGGTQWYQQDRIYDDNIAISVCTGFNPYYKDNLRIRKLTPKECWRLMGFSDQDFDKASKVNSNAQLYKQAGNSIVVNVLEAIFSQML